MKYTPTHHLGMNLIIAMAFTLLCSCSEFLDVGTPSTQIARQDVYADDATAKAALNGIYSEMIFSGGFASGAVGSITLLAGRSSDEFIDHSGSRIAEFSNNALTENNPYLGSNIWNEPYRYIYYANAALEGLFQSQDVTPATKQQLRGEALFIRAFCYFYLVNLFGDVPLLTSTDFKSNSVAHRSTASVIYDQIISDLNAARSLLPTDYSSSYGERTKPNHGAATALLARTYLYQEKWGMADEIASEVIENPLYGLENDLDAAFLKNSTEAIWQLIPSAGTINTQEGALFILTSTPTEVSLSNSLVESFEAGDLRRAHWVGSIESAGNTYYYPFKYKIKSGATISEYSMVLRLAEQYLIRAEARARMEDLDGAIDDLDIIRARAGLPLYSETNPALTQTEVLEAIQQERRVELFSEWGHRWVDLKRTGQADAVLSVEKSGSWQATDVLYPIPFSEIQNNQNLLPQNPGY